MAIPLKINSHLAFMLSLVHLFHSLCLAWHLDKFMQTPDLKLWHSILITLSYLFKTFSHSVHCQAIGLTGKCHVFCWQWALKWNGNEHQLHVCLFARYRKLPIISSPFIGPSTGYKPSPTPNIPPLLWLVLKWICLFMFWGLQKPSNSKSIWLALLCSLLWNIFFCPAISPCPYLKALLKPLTKLYKPRAYNLKFTVLVYSKLSCNGHLNKIDTLFQAKLHPSSRELTVTITYSKWNESLSFECMKTFP